MVKKAECDYIDALNVVLSVEELFALFNGWQMELEWSKSICYFNLKPLLVFIDIFILTYFSQAVLTL